MTKQIRKRSISANVDLGIVLRSLGPPQDPKPASDKDYPLDPLLADNTIQEIQPGTSKLAYFKSLATEVTKVAQNR